MKKLSYIESNMLPLPMSNIDTDQIMHRWQQLQQLMVILLILERVNKNEKA